EPDAMPGVYARHDLYLQSPDIDNMPLSVLEAFASGAAVVSTDAGGVKGLPEHGRAGLLSPTGDPPTPGADPARGLDRPDEARRRARAARESLSAYAWPEVRRQWLHVYESALSSRAAVYREARA